MKVKNSIVIRIIAKLIFFLCCSHIPFKYFLSVVDHVDGGGGFLCNGNMKYQGQYLQTICLFIFLLHTVQI